MVGAQTDVVVGGINPFEITALENNSAGYSLTFCYECTISAGPNVFTKDLITVTQNTLDCSTALSDAGFVNPPAIPYSSDSSKISFTSGYTDFFNHASVADCPLESCEIKKTGCKQNFMFILEVSVSISSPYEIKVKQNEPLGFTHEICFICTITG